MAQVVFIIVAAVTLLAGLATVNLSNIFHAALALVGALLGVAALFALLGAGYLAVVQVLVYVGAVSVLIILGIMVSERFMGRRSQQFGEQRWLAAGVAVVLFAALGYLALTVAWPQVAATPPVDGVARLGEALVGRYVLPFEVASLVLLASLIGAIYIAREK
ncbi:MAG: NADH-quinone oxidoreductase subunit J family protein [Anaerolineae bacterium]